jgi:hypothetical protein
MGIYNFKPQFVSFILDGSKRHTIRASRKYMDKPGDMCHLYTGLRQKGAKLLFRAPCLKVEEIFIDSRELTAGSTFIDMRVNGIPLSWDEKNELAWRDGFRGIDGDPRVPRSPWLTNTQCRPRSSTLSSELYLPQVGR